MAGKKLVVSGAKLKCDKGSGECSLNALRMMPTVSIEGVAVAIATDKLPVNVSSFIMCKSQANPAVIAIMAASQGATKEAPCVALAAGDWASPSALLTVAGAAAITEKSTLKCMWAGTIKITDPGQELVTVAK